MQLRHSRQFLSQSSSDGAMIQLWLLGPMQVSGVAGEVPLAARKSRALLLYLAMKRGAPVPRQTLVGLLWGDRSEDQARASLRQTLSALRKDLGEDVAKRLTTAGDSVSLAVEGVWADIDELERASDKSSVESLESAAALFRGDLAEGLAINEPAFDHWLAAERERIRYQMLRVLKVLVSLLGQNNQIEEAITQCAKALAFDPFQEKMHRLLIGFYMEQGRHDAALAQFEQCRRTLADQLGVAPEQETLDLVAEVKARRRRMAAKPVAQEMPVGMDGHTSQSLTVYSAAPPLPDKPSLAVLPFTNMSADPEQEFFSDGISEDIITELGRYSELFVIARNSSFAFKNAVIDAREIGQKLGVRYLLEGSVRKIGDRIRVTAQLVDTTHATQIWADRYDRELIDIFEIQDELTRSIASTVKGRVDATGFKHVVRKPISSLSAYECVIRGQALVHQFTEASLDEAKRILNTAIALDPDMARTYGWLAYVEAYEELYWRVSTPKLERAIQIGEKGLALDANDSRCHVALGLSYLFRQEFEKAAHHLTRASSINPNDALGMIEMGRFNMYTNEPDKGAEYVRRAMRQNPYHPNWYWNVLARCHHTAKDYRGAISALEQLETLHYWHHGYLAACYVELGQTEKARKHVTLALTLKPNFSIRQFKLVHPYRDKQVLEDFFVSYKKAGFPD